MTSHPFIKSVSFEPEWPSEAERTRRYEDELVRRFLAGLPLTNSDKRDARKILRRTVKRMNIHRCHGHA